jgi:hypothetical protein
LRGAGSVQAPLMTECDTALLFPSSSWCAAAAAPSAPHRSERKARAQVASLVARLNRDSDDDDDGDDDAGAGNRGRGTKRGAGNRKASPHGSASSVDGGSTASQGRWGADEARGTSVVATARSAASRCLYACQVQDHARANSHRA